MRLPYPSLCVACLSVQWTAVSKLRHCMPHGVVNFWVQTHVLHASECSELLRAFYLEHVIPTEPLNKTFPLIQGSPHTHTGLVVSSQVKSKLVRFEVKSTWVRSRNGMKKQQLHQPICTWNSLEEKQVIITKPAGTWKRRPVFTSQGGVKVFFGPSFPHSSGTPCVEFTHTHVIYIHTFSWQFGMGWRNFKLGTFVGSHLRSRWRFTTTLVPAPGPCRPSDGGAATVLYVNMFLVILKNMQKNHLPATLIKKIRMCFYIFFRTFGSIKWLQVRVTVILSHLRGLGSQCSVGWRCESPQNRSKMVQPFFF